MAFEQFRLPDLGEGLPDAEIVRWLVEVGDPITVNQPIAEVETAKALVEVPSPLAGVLATRHAEAGETVEVGRPLVTVDTGGETSGGPLASVPGTVPEADRGPADLPDGRTPVLVGYGPRDRSGPSRARTHRRGGQVGTPGAIHGTTTPTNTSVTVTTTPVTTRVSQQPDQPERRSRRVAVLAKPPVRKLARDLGVDLQAIIGTGPHGTISRADVESARKSASGHRATRTHLVPVTGVRRAIAEAMVTSAFNAPQVTEFVSVDVTRTLAARDRIAALPEFSGVKVTPLLFIAKALLTAVRRHPMVNSSWEDPVGDEPAQIAVHEYVNLGIAVAAPRGLVVPNIPDAGELGLVALAHALHDLTVTARAGKLTPQALRGGTITITNIGVFGVDIGTPILNPPEAAILALGAIRPMPWVHEGELAVRTVAQLALTFDHRIVDGELGAKVLTDVARMLTDPTVILALS